MKPRSRNVAQVEPTAACARAGHPGHVTLTGHPGHMTLTGHPGHMTLTGLGHTGITLVELLIVLVMASVLLAAAAPSFHQSLQRLRLQAAVNDFLAAIDLTRSQAMARGDKVMMAPLDATGADWQSGWAIFLDRNSNRRPDPGEPLIYRHDPLRPGITVSAKFTSNNVPAYLAYNAAGRTCSATSSLTARWGTLTLIQGEQTRNIKINMLGRVRVCDPRADGADCTGAAD